MALNPNTFFIQDGNSIKVNCPLLEVYVPDEYMDNGSYEVVGQDSKWFGIGNYKAFQSESELDHRDRIPTYPIGIAAFITSRPSERDVGDIQFTKGGIARPCIIMRFYKGDLFMVNRNVIKMVENMSKLTQMLEAGKLDHVPPSVVSDLIQHNQEITNVSLRLPASYFDTIVVERYRDPNNPKHKLRHAKENNSEGKVVSITPREDAMTATTFQGFTFEDVNSSLIAGCNQSRKGEKSEPTIMEQLIRGEEINL